MDHRRDCLAPGGDAGMQVAQRVSEDPVRDSLVPPDAAQDNCRRQCHLHQEAVRGNDRRSLHHHQSVGQGNCRSPTRSRDG